MSFRIAQIPTEPVDVPPEVAALAGSRPLTAVWKNELGGVTWSADDIHIKWSPRTADIDLTIEAARLAWFRLHVPDIPCPIIVEQGSNERAQWLVTETIPARTAVATTGDQIPTAVDAIATGLRRLHDSIPASECPFSWSTDDRRQRALARLDRGDVDPLRLHPQHQHLSPTDMAATLGELPDSHPLGDPVLCHGDACAPNTLIDTSGHFAGLVDLGALGVGQRWADIAVAAWSLEWNFGEGWTDRFLDRYAIERDDDLLAWHQLLWDLG
jgi:kanamycin kinase